MTDHWIVVRTSAVGLPARYWTGSGWTENRELAVPYTERNAKDWADRVHRSTPTAPGTVTTTERL